MLSLDVWHSGEQELNLKALKWELQFPRSEEVTDWGTGEGPSPKHEHLLIYATFSSLPYSQLWNLNLDLSSNCWMAFDDSSLPLTQKSNTIFCFAHNAFWEIDEDIRDTEEIFNLSFFFLQPCILSLYWMITLQLLPFPSYSGDSDKGRSHLILLQCPSPKEGVCIFYQKAINVLWYNRVKRRRGKPPSWFQYALLISQSHCHKNASTGIENRNIISTIQLWNLIWPKRGLGDFSTLSGQLGVLCINTNIPGKLCNESHSLWQ